MALAMRTPEERQRLAELQAQDWWLPTQATRGRRAVPVRVTDAQLMGGGYHVVVWPLLTRDLTRAPIRPIPESWLCRTQRQAHVISVDEEPS